MYQKSSPGRVLRRESGGKKVHCSRKRLSALW
jgi:hypothetical protein